jgi:hypothetical protein
MGKAGQPIPAWVADYKYRKDAGLADFRDTSPTEPEPEDFEDYNADSMSPHKKAKGYATAWR